MLKSVLSRLALFYIGFRITFRSGKSETILLLSALCIQGVIPVGFLFALRTLIEWLSYSDRTSYLPIVLSVTLWGGALLLQTILSPLALTCRVRLNEKIFTHVQQAIMEKANSLELLTPFHDASLQKEIHYLREESRSKPMNFVYNIASTAREFVAVISLSAILVPVSPLLPVLVMLACVPHAISAMRLESQGWDMSLFRSLNARHLASLAALPLDLKAAKEIRIFDFGPRLVKMFRRTAFFFHSKARAERKKHVKQAILLSTISVIANFGILGWLIVGAVQGRWGAAQLVVGLQAFIMIQSEVGQLMASFALLVPNLYFFRQLRAFLNFEESPPNTAKRPVLDKFNRVDFENVCFRYPGGDWVLKDINLTIHAGERVAIVGENGAGKR
jgi:ATP-binding cassette, subfamily B, bacterial